MTEDIEGDIEDLGSASDSDFDFNPSEYDDYGCSTIVAAMGDPRDTSGTDTASEECITEHEYDFSDTEYELDFFDDIGGGALLWEMETFGNLEANMAQAERGIVNTEGQEGSTTGSTAIAAYH